MNRKAVTLGFVLVFALLVSCAATAPDQSVKNTELYFSPRGNCTDAVVKQLANAKESIVEA